MRHAPDPHALPHEAHDRLLVAALADGDLAPDERDRATALTAACGDCGRLHDDLVSIARATAALPAAVRPRDFRITAEQAARLRPAGWRRLIAAFAAPRLAFTRPLGIGLTTLGLAGLLVSNVPLQLGAGGAATPAPSTEYQAIDSASGQPDVVGEGAAPAASQPAASSQAWSSASPGTVVMAPNASTAPVDGVDRESGDPRVTGQGEPGEDAGPGASPLVMVDDAPADPTPASPVAVGSAVAVLAGLAILVLRRVGRRFAGS